MTDEIERLEAENAALRQAMEMLRQAMEIVDSRLQLLARTYPTGDVFNAAIAMRNLIARTGRPGVDYDPTGEDGDQSGSHAGYRHKDNISRTGDAS